MIHPATRLAPVLGVAAAAALVSVHPALAQDNVPADPPAEEVPAKAPPAMFLTAADPAPSSLCQAGEQLLFSGNVLDDFGLGLSVCASPGERDAPATIAIRSEGEGGGTVVQCLATECGGFIEMTQYTRPRFTVLTLEWMDNGNWNKLTESYDAEQTADGEGVSVVRFQWASEDMLEAGTEPLDDPVEAFTEPLSMLALTQYLEVSR
ncbi:hypothetical protein [Parerythrobacter aestuarii]|uniref:hypothetical protein n=1 Tax=Parerythrobacter aestuarii TaxID=3020909 RepID=UPI0024DED7B1|nr:hypothetical protein [Parerythrobacter aestuarii]